LCEQKAVFPVSGNGKPGVDQERSDNRIVRVERRTWFYSSPGFDYISI